MDRRKSVEAIRTLHKLKMLRDMRKSRKHKRHRRFWVRSIYQKRNQLGAFWTLVQELKVDRELFFRYLRMTPERFNHLHELVRDKIQQNK